MKQTIGLSKFRDAFRDMDRKENFSYEALELLFDYFEEVDENMELDVIAICCDFYENDLETVISEYQLYDDVKEMNEVETTDFVREYLNGHTFLVGETPTGFVYQAF